MKQTKQVIVMRKDLNMRKGKMIAQGSHAAMSFMTRPLGRNDSEADLWFVNGFTKVCLYVNSEEELDKIYDKAYKAGLEVHMVVDSGKTEFNGIPTKTCLAIGPHYSETIDKITGHLKLL